MPVSREKINLQLLNYYQVQVLKPCETEKGEPEKKVFDLTLQQFIGGYPVTNAKYLQLGLQGDGKGSDIVVSLPPEVEEKYSQNNEADRLICMKNDGQIPGTHRTFNRTFTISGDTFDNISFEGLLKGTQLVSTKYEVDKENNNQRYVIVEGYDIDGDNAPDVYFKKYVDPKSIGINPAEHEQLKAERAKAEKAKSAESDSFGAPLHKSD